MTLFYPEYCTTVGHKDYGSTKCMMNGKIKEVCDAIVKQIAKDTIAIEVVKHASEGKRKSTSNVWSYIVHIIYVLLTTAKLTFSLYTLYNMDDIKLGKCFEILAFNLCTGIVSANEKRSNKQ